MPYELPSDDIVAIIDAPPTPAASLSPDGRFIVLVHYESHPPVRLLARPFLRLAGIRVDPTISGRQRTLRLVGLSVVTVADGETRSVPLPQGAMVSVPHWAPDSTRFLFTVDRVDGIGLWIGDAPTATARELDGVVVRDVLTGGQLGGGGPARWSRDGRSVLALCAPSPAPPLPEADPADGPRISESIGKHTQMATFQDLLTSELDEAQFEALATTVPTRVDVESGARSVLHEPGLFTSVEDSPDGEHLLARQLLRPFSYRVPYPYFAHRVEIWNRAGELEKTVADEPLKDEVPRQGVPTGPRRVDWLEASPATLAWIEALDGGDPMQPAEHRDRIMVWASPFREAAVQSALVEHRCLGWYHFATPQNLFVVEHDRDRRWVTESMVDLSDPARRRVLSDRSMNDAYADPGDPVSTLNPDGTHTVVQDGSTIYLRGEGSTPDGDHPFLDRFDLETGEKERLHVSPPDAIERVVGFAGGDRSQFVLRHESPTEPPNFSVLDATGARRPLTSFPDPHPQLTGMSRRIITHDRGDGVQLSGKLHLPPGYDAERDGRLPLVVWAYPLDFSDSGTAGQVRGSTQSFTRLHALLPVWFVLKGYAVLLDATMPVIGDPETMNDTYIEQTTMAAKAHIDVLDAEGIVDRTRVIVGGHSYGGFMTANLLAHTDLFAAGIARSGAYNRSLTPFGFQTERRNFWEATNVYDRVSPFRYADQITTPILLIHGAADSNPGTFTVQSERMFQAIQGTGGTARLVLLPHESHGYLGRESVLHLLAEQFAWAERWASAAPPAEVAPETAVPALAAVPT